jgi:hypothetical protein
VNFLLFQFIEDMEDENSLSPNTLAKFIKLIECILKQGVSILIKNNNFMDPILKTLGLFAEKKWKTLREVSVLFGQSHIIKISNLILN